MPTFWYFTVISFSKAWKNVLFVFSFLHALFSCTTYYYLLFTLNYKKQLSFIWEAQLKEGEQMAYQISILLKEQNKNNYVNHKWRLATELKKLGHAVTNGYHW